MFHTPHSPDLASSDCVSELKETLRGQRFSSNDKLEDATNEWLLEVAVRSIFLYLH